jgi:hypothetical protein
MIVMMVMMVVVVVVVVVIPAQAGIPGQARDDRES